MEAIVSSVIAIFVVSNLLPILPIVLGIADKINSEEAKQKFLIKSLTVGYVSAFVFGIAGLWLFSALGIILPDLMIAGGIVLLVFSIYDLLFSREERKEKDKASDVSSDTGEPSVVPLAIPLIVGPATLTTAVVLVQSHGIPITIIALIINYIINILIIKFSTRISNTLDSSFMKAAGKVFSLVLAALSVSMIRTGISEILK